MSKETLIITVPAMIALVLLALNCTEGPPMVSTVWDELLLASEQLPLRLACLSSFDSGLAGACSVGLP